jgi:predicted transcriptional regulator
VNDHERALVLSLRPRFADSILDGHKSVELRRQRVSPSLGTPVLLYASAPVMAVVGTARVAEVHVDEPDCMWRQFHMDLGLKREEFEQYVAGATRASALRLTDIDRLWAPVSLAHLRHAQPFNPPQSYRYLTCDALERLVQGHPVASELRRFRERASPLPQGQARSR